MGFELRFPVALVVACTLLALETEAQQPDLSVVERWLQTNTGVSSVQIEFNQTRKMKAVNLPIRQSGVLWLDYGPVNRFRWQTGDPPQTIVVGHGSDILIMRTPLKRFEKRSGDGSDSTGMASLANGFPKTLDEFHRNYRVLEVTPLDNTYRIVTKPAGPAGRGVETFTFVVQREGFRLLGIELDLSDGSEMDTVFTGVHPNVPLPDKLFAPDLSGYHETKF